MADEKQFGESDILQDEIDLGEDGPEIDNESISLSDDDDEDQDQDQDQDEDDDLGLSIEEIQKDNQFGSSGVEDVNVEYYDSDEDEEEEFDKLNNQDLTVDLLQDHPEFNSHNIKEVNALCNIIRDSNGNIMDELHRTIPFITRYEKAKILGERSKQLSYSNVEPMINVPSDMIDSYEIAKLEYNANAIPFIVKRNLPDGSCEYWKFKDLEKIIFD